MSLTNIAPVTTPDAKLVDALHEMLKSRCRCALVEQDGRPIGILSLMPLVRRLALEWMYAGIPPHEALEKIRVSELRLYPPLVFEEKPEAVKALIDMVTYGLNAIIVGGSSIYTILDALMESLHVLRGEVVRSVLAAQSWWSTKPNVSVRDAFLQVSMLPTWRLVLVDEYGAVVGIFSATDFLDAILRGDYDYEKPALSIATKAPRTADVDESLVTVIRIMAEHNIHFMPVVSGIEGFAGVAHAFDIARLTVIKLLKRMEGG